MSYFFAETYFFKKDFIYLFLERGREGERGERNIKVWLPLVQPLLGIRPATQACALDWELNQLTFDSQAGAQPLSHSSQGWSFVLFFHLDHVSLSPHFGSLPVFLRYEVELTMSPRLGRVA